MAEMKKRISLFLAFAMAFLFIACSPQGTVEQVDYEIAMLSNTSGIEDGSFNQAVWKGIEDFVEEEPVSYKHYMTGEDTTSAYLRTIEQASDSGAKFVIAAGADFGNAVYEAQEEHPELSFILVDGQPYSKSPSDAVVEKNTLALLFAEEQAGFLAGYAAVKEGYRKLGFIGGKELSPVQSFGCGFIQGAREAAEEEELQGIAIAYTYADTFQQDEQVEQLANKWYSAGTELIFSCAGGAGRSIIRAAEKTGGKVIGSDTDQSHQSESVVLSAVKNLDESICDILQTYYGENEFAGGQTITLNAENEGIGLSMDTSRMKHFTSREYDEIYRKLAEGKMKVEKDGIEDVQALSDDRVQVESVSIN